MSGPTTISVIINTFNRADSLDLTLRALQQVDPVDLEVVVVDGPSTDHTDEVLARWADRIQIGRCPERNLSMSRNVGIRLATGDVVAFIDDDAYPDPGWLVALLGGYDHPEIAAVGGPVLDHTGASLQARYSLADRTGEAWVITSDDAPNPTWLFNAPSSRTFLYTIGTNSSFRRDLLVAIGGFDEEYEYYLDETDVCVRLADHGFAVRHVDDAVVHHKFLPSDVRNSSRATKDRYAVLKNRVYFGLTHSQGTHSPEERARSLVDFVDSCRNDVEFHLALGNLERADRERFERHVAEATRVGQERHAEGPKTRDPAWFDVRRERRPFPITTPADGRRLHLCFLSQEHPPGRVNGIGRIVHSQAVELARQGHVVRVLTRGEHPDRVDLEDGVWVHRLVTRPHDLPADFAGFPQWLWDQSATAADEVAHVDRLRPVDLVQAPNWDCEGLAVARTGRWRTAVSLHTPLAGMMEIDPQLIGVGAQPMLDAETWIYRAADLVVSNGPAVEAEIEALYPVTFDRPRTVTIPHALTDTRDPDAPPRDGTGHILFVGRLERRKGIDGLLAALPAVLDRHPGARCTIVGDDTIPAAPGGATFRQVFERSGDASRLGDRVRFAGRVDDDERERLYATCDVLVAPSRFESFGLITLEAMMAGMPVIVGDCVAIRDIVADGAGLVASADDPPSIAAALDEVLGDATRRAELGAAGRRRYEERFTPEAMGRACVTAYRAALARRRSVGSAA